jgi:acyl-CoA synthetase (AMP-forming)/AMP-acid ligase II
MDASRPAAADPERLIEALRDFGCTNLFASPALIDKLGRHCEAHAITLSTLRRAISAGAPASIPALERFAAVLPASAQVFTPYGATECLPVSVIGSDEILAHTRAATEAGNGVCVGEPVPGMQARVIAIHDDPIERWSDALARPTGEIGEIVVRGPVVTPGYFDREASTRAAKIPDPEGGVWHRMGDVGHFDDRGRLWMCGRKAHRVEHGGITSFSVACEAPFNTHPAVFRSALVGVRREGATRPVICVELEKGARIERATLFAELAAIAARHQHTRDIETFLVHPAFPVDVRHNAKIFREKLAVWAAEQLA